MGESGKGLSCVSSTFLNQMLYFFPQCMHHYISNPAAFYAYSQSALRWHLSGHPTFTWGDCWWCEVLRTCKRCEKEEREGADVLQVQLLIKLTRFLQDRKYCSSSCNLVWIVLTWMGLPFTGKCEKTEWIVCLHFNFKNMFAGSHPWTPCSWGVWAGVGTVSGAATPFVCHQPSCNLGGEKG